MSMCAKGAHPSMRTLNGMKSTTWIPSISLTPTPLPSHVAKSSVRPSTAGNLPCLQRRAKTSFSTPTVTKKLLMQNVIIDHLLFEFFAQLRFFWEAMCFWMKVEGKPHMIRLRPSSGTYILLFASLRVTILSLPSKQTESVSAPKLPVRSRCRCHKLFGLVLFINSIKKEKSRKEMGEKMFGE